MTKTAKAIIYAVGTGTLSSIGIITAAQVLDARVCIVAVLTAVATGCAGLIAYLDRTPK